ncbi:unnamed protein product [Taphrina deformans PYCC 5710]|uniref:Uncharacterized protein n=1 Tax=Taphrina deformans (strain PYCC 5710 / ATCC 11124 / CBS 356.35 / IMI 108563 / JCM 9778 / NBRC 8474) TaxID=1097556 RepID=R4XNS0_TAPDE|nr:unnamed protein product [Taphrina deformans PYCC 5710]|eukprot:CCG84909.1 unnamed protein product [Taphrina deformans PYCC 5710]
MEPVTNKTPAGSDPTEPATPQVTISDSSCAGLSESDAESTSRGPFDWKSYGFAAEDVLDAQFQPVKKGLHLGIITLKSKGQSMYRITVTCAQKEQIFRELMSQARMGTPSDEQTAAVARKLHNMSLSAGKRTVNLQVTCSHSPLQSKFSPDTPDPSERDGTTCSRTPDRPSPAFSQTSSVANYLEERRGSWTANQI